MFALKIKSLINEIDINRGYKMYLASGYPNSGNNSNSLRSLAKLARIPLHLRAGISNLIASLYY